MGDYRAYIIGKDGHFVKAVELDCLDDEHAIKSAKQLVNGSDAELWERDRRIAQLSKDAK